MTTAYPLLLKRGQKIVTENRTFTVHAVDFWEKERFGPLVNKVFIETTVGTLLSFPLGMQVELK